MSSNAKIVVRKKPNKNGLYPLAIRISKNRRSNYHYIGHYIKLEDWDEKNIRVKKSHPSAANLNNLLVKKLSEANKMLMDLQAEKLDLSANRIKDKLYKKSNGISFSEVAKAFLDDLQANKKLSRYYSDRARVNHVLNYSKSNQLSFQEIDEQFLRNFMTYLKIKVGLSERSIMNNLVVVRTLYNRAIKLGIVDRQLYPFGADRIKIKFPESKRIGLNKDELIALENVEGLTENEKHAKNVWLFSFYFAGIRVADVINIRWSDISDNRLNYRMNKNSKLLSMRIPEKAFQILEDYLSMKQSDDDFIFPEMKMVNLNESKAIFRKINAATMWLNKYLARVAKKARIKKKITMHIARHSFGTISEDKIPIKMLQKLYRHSSITTTINYQTNFMHKDADDALDSVINF